MMEVARQTSVEPSPGLSRLPLAALAIFVLVDVMAHLSVYGSFALAVGIALLLEPLLLALALALRAQFRRWPAEPRITPHHLPWIVGLSLLAALVMVVAGEVVRAWFALEFDPRSGGLGRLIALIYYLLLFVIWGVICFWTRSEIARLAERDRAIEAEAQAMRAELERLRLQINPHFLFNALNGIGEEIPENPSAALAMLTHLGVFLRQALEGVGTPLGTVAAEAEALAAYLQVQQARFGARLKPRLEVTPEAAARRLPNLLLQPLVENAIKHGRRDPVLELGVTLHVERDALVAVVTNPGALETGMRAGGIGLANIRHRLALHYPGRHRFTLETAGGLVTARLWLEGEPCSAS